jgi:oligoendopeptidase F
MDYNKREEIEEKYKWDLTTRYKNDEAWEKDYEKIKKSLKDISKYEKNLTKSADNLLDALDTYFKLETKLNKLYGYAFLKHDEDLSVSKYSLYLNKAYGLFNEFISLSSYITPEILKTSKTVMDKYLKDKKLAKYHFILTDTLRYKKHTLSAKEEKLVSKLSTNDMVFDKISSTLINSCLNYGTINIDGKDIEITNSNYRNIMMNKDRSIRSKCYNLMSNKLKEFIDIFGDTLIANMKLVSNYAEIKNYQSTMDMELFNSNIPKEVIDNLYTVVHKRLDVYQKYLKFLKMNLGLEKLEYYDLNAEYINNSATFTIQDAQELIMEATKIYGNKYHNIIKKAFAESWIDYGSYKGKRSGAYCTANYKDHPVILTNFHSKFTDVSAIAHELGHAVNFYLSMENNDAHNYQNDIFVAEVASLTNEIILSNYIMTNSKDKNLKLLAISNLIDIIQNNLFDAALEGELENEVYKLVDTKEEIDANTLSECIYNLRKKYYGNVVELDENVKYHWARRSHYYSPFYLYQYATGVSCAIYVATKIIDGDENMKKSYLEFLSKGSTNYPVNLLKEIGIDITSEEVINKAIDYFDFLLNEYSKVSEE